MPKCNLQQDSAQIDAVAIDICALKKLIIAN